MITFSTVKPLSETDLHTLLARRIEASQGSGLTRQDIYAAARAALKKQAVLHRPYLGIDEIHRCMATLEAAIARLEAEFPEPEQAPVTVDREASPDAPPADAADGAQRHEDSGDADAESEAQVNAPVARPLRVAGRTASAPQEPAPMSSSDEVPAPPDEMPPAVALDARPHRDLVVRSLRQRDIAEFYDVDLIPPDPVSRHAYQPPPPPSTTHRILASTALLVQLTIASLAGVSLYALLSGQGLPGLGGEHGTPAPAVVATSQAPPAPTETRPVEPSSEGRVALPSMFGVYAVRDGRLIELEPVATEPVDPRAKHLQQIVKPARTVLPDGRLTFLVFRRELIVNAPERIPVRFVAKLSRLMSFDPQGKAVWTSPAKDTWLIRDAGFDFRVMPVKESPEMVYVRAEDPGFTLPAGRYALMVGGQPYDFMVEGPVTDPGHCVEGSATMRGPVFYECKPS